MEWVRSNHAKLQCIAEPTSQPDRRNLSWKKRFGCTDVCEQDHQRTSQQTRGKEMTEEKTEPIPKKYIIASILFVIVVISVYIVTVLTVTPENGGIWFITIPLTLVGIFIVLIIMSGYR